MLQVGILQHVVQVMRMVVMVVGSVAGSGGVRRIDGEEDAQVIAPGPHGGGDTAHSSLHVLVRVYVVVMLLLLLLLLIVQVTVSRQRAVLMHLGQVVMLLLLMMMLLLLLMMIVRVR